MKEHSNRLLSSLGMALTIVSCFSSQANATTYSGSVELPEYCSLGICYPTAGSFSLIIQNANTTPLGSGTLALEWYGESDDNAGEWLDLEMEGYSFGRLANGDPGDDLFGGAGAGGPDRWYMYYQDGLDKLISVSAPIPLSALATIVSDGKADIYGTFGYDVDDYGTGEYVRLTLSYEVATVPEPATYLLLLAGLGVVAPFARKLNPSRI